MNIKKFQITLFCALFSLVGLTTFAETFEKSNIASDAKWVMHFDCTKAQSTELYKNIKPMIDEKIDFARQFEKLKSFIDFDIEKNLHSVTLYGSTPKHDEFVMLIDTNTAEIPAAIKLEEHTIKTHTYSDYSIYELPDKKAERMGHKNKTVLLCLKDASRAIITKKMDVMKNALGVLDGTVVNLDQAEKPSIALPDIGSAFFFCAGNLAELKKEMQPRAATFIHGEAFTVVAKEENGNLNIDVELTTKDEATATNMQNMAKGFLGMAQLSPKAKEVIDILNSIKPTADGKVVKINFNYSSADLVTKAKEMKEKMKKHHHGHGCKHSHKSKETQKEE